MNQPEDHEPTPGVVARPDLFGRRTARVLAVTLPTLLVITFVYVLTAPVGTSGRRHGSNTYSVSAVGFKGLAEMLEGLDLAVLSSRRASGQRCGPSTPLVLLEPPVASSSGTTLSGLIEQAEAREAKIVVVLPKWGSRSQSRRPDWSAEVWPVGTQTPRSVLAAILDMELDTSSIVRLDRPVAAGWSSEIPGSHPPVLPYPQLMSARIKELDPIIWSSEGVLAARVTGRGITVVSDPDVMNNVGLSSADNAVIAHRLILGRPSAETVVFDESLHDFTAAPSIWKELFRFPLSLVTIQLGLLMLAVVWIGAIRFGKTESPPPRFIAGTTTLIVATSRLLSLADRPADTLRRYWRVMLRRTSEDLAPSRGSHAGRSPEQELAHLNAVGKRRGSIIDLEELGTDVFRQSGRSADRTRILFTAQSIYAWRRDVIHGPHQNR